MFDLDKEVAGWSASIQAKRCDRDASVDELVDHVHSEIERLTAEGRSEERAFDLATSKIGDTIDLDAEFDKNRSLFARIGRRVHSHDDSLTTGPRRAHSIFGATLLIAAAIVLAVVDAPAAGAYLLFVFVPLWFASGELLNRR